jgi:glutamate synthase (NADPH/NADH) large chain
VFFPQNMEMQAVPEWKSAPACSGKDDPAPKQTESSDIYGRKQRRFERISNAVLLFSDFICPQVSTGGRREMSVWCSVQAVRSRSASCGKGVETMTDQQTNQNTDVGQWAQEGALYNEREHDACGIGAIVNIDGSRTHEVVADALRIVENLDHRAGKDADGNVGDGVGILLQVSHDFFSKCTEQAGITVGNAGDYGVGMFFFPQEERRRTVDKRKFEVICRKNELTFLGWRNVPVRPEILGKRAKDCMPDIEQAFVARPDGCAKGYDFDRRLYTLRREFEQGLKGTTVVSLSSRTVVYKGMFLVRQLGAFYPDLQDERNRSALAIVHSRFSTNTTPSWERAHPYRLIAHNGEINTIRGNVDRMLAREETMSSPFMEENIDKVLPVISASGSDSAMLDNTLEFLYMSGMDLPLALMITVPEPWKHDPSMDAARKDFLHYYATMMEPWDGPAAIVCSDGEQFIAQLDRNGLRPSRYYVTDDGRLILSSEVGVLDIPPEKIVKKSRLMPGRMLLVDLNEKRIVSDEECKNRYAHRCPYGEWLAMHLVPLSSVPIPNRKIPGHTQEMREKLYKVFGYTFEDIRDIILPMARTGVEPTASMGHDIPLAILSEKHQPLFHYFKQQFAQVTNPPIDSLREKIVTDTTVYIGSDGNLLEERGENCGMLEVDNPILTGVDLMKIRSLDRPGLRAKTVSILFYKNTPLEQAVEQLSITVDRAYAKGYNIIILSDRGVDENHVPIPSLLAVSSVEQHLVRTKKRTAVSLVLESGEPRDVHQIAALLSFGARAVNPYLAQECISELIDTGMLDKDYHTAIEDYNSAILNGVVKTAAKMGISTLESYESARIFEAVGLKKEVIDRYFTGTVSRVGGIGLEEIEEGVLFRHDHAFDPLGLGTDTSLDSTGYHQLRSGTDKEDHLYSPETIVLLQQACRTGDYSIFQEYAKRVDFGRPHTLRGLLTFRAQQDPVPLSEVEPASEIVKRFKTGAMSFGSISQEAHETLAVAMNRLGGKSNSGEGGEDASRFGTEKNSAIKQVASGRFGVTSEYLNSAVDIQIKMAQGAKPGEGGNLPGKKVYPWVARMRCSTPGVALISPPPHHDIYSIEDLAELIYDLKNANRHARISVKLVAESGVGTIAAGVAKAGAEVILISGYDGGTGAAPISSIHNAGLPWELGLSETHQTLIRNGLRGRVALETDGKLMTGRDVAVACMLGAEEFGFATAPLISMGCMMMKACSRDTCPVGIATQNQEFRKRFRGKPEHVMNFMNFVAEGLREVMASLGFRTVSEMVGRTDCLAMKEKQITKRAAMVDLSCILSQKYAKTETRHFEPSKRYDFHLEKTVDERVLLPALEKADKEGEAATKGFRISIRVSSTDRTTGTIFGSVVTERFGTHVPEDTFVIECTGGGGQSFGAFLPSGVTMRLVGDSNDGFGKGLSGGKLVLTPPAKSRFVSSENILCGNVALYGATAGKAFLSGVAGERFCVRNSGATAVSEGCGDHGLEYMTGGRVVILGETGDNFAAGMSGGFAYVLDRAHTLYQRINRTLVQMRPVTEEEDIEELKGIIEEFTRETGSAVGSEVLCSFDEMLPDFKKIVPTDYEAMRNAIAQKEKEGMTRDEAELAAFEDRMR